MAAVKQAVQFRKAGVKILHRGMISAAEVVRFVPENLISIFKIAKSFHKKNEFFSINSVYYHVF
jgi:hypothetical protein